MGEEVLPRVLRQGSLDPLPGTPDTPPINNRTERILLLSDESEDDEEEVLSRDLENRLSFKKMRDQSEVEVRWMTGSPEGVLASFRFEALASSRFQHGADHRHVTGAIYEPLLSKTHQLDKLASLATWMAIQKFAGETNHPTTTSRKKSQDSMPMIVIVYKAMLNFQERYIRKQEKKERGGLRRRLSSWGNTESSEVNYSSLDEEPVKIRRGRSLKRLLRMTKRQRTQSLKETLRVPILRRSISTSDFEYLEEPDAVLERLPSHELDLVHFLVAHGLLRYELRDEIYCQLLKQLTENPSKKSEEKCWILLAMCINCFLPSNLLLPYVRNLLQGVTGEFKEKYGLLIWDMLCRTQCNGRRFQPPSSLEYMSLVKGRPVEMPVNMGDGRMGVLIADGASTTGEICQMLARQCGILDHTGFSLYLFIRNEMISLGCGSEHVFDDISEHEQITRARGLQKEDANWHLIYRAEIFSPWLDPVADPKAAAFIVGQIYYELHFREDIDIPEDECALLAAQMFLVRQKSSDGEVLRTTLEDYLPKNTLVHAHDRDVWFNRVMDHVNAIGQPGCNVSPDKLIVEIVQTLLDSWHMQYSSEFKVHWVEAPQAIKERRVVVAVNHKGFFVMLRPITTRKILCSIDYYKMADIFPTKTTADKTLGFTVVTTTGERYTFTCSYSRDIVILLRVFTEGLRRKSKFAVCVHDIRNLGTEDGTDESFSVRKGELLVILSNQSNDYAETRDNLEVIRVRDGQKGHIAAENVYIIPTITKPPDDYLAQLSKLPQEKLEGLRQRKGIIVLGGDENGMGMGSVTHVSTV